MIIIIIVNLIRHIIYVSERKIFPQVWQIKKKDRLREITQLLTNNINLVI